MRTRLDEDHDDRVARGHLFNCLQLVEPAHGTRGSSGVALSQKAGAGARATRGGLGAALSWEVGARATGTHDGPRAALSREAGAGALGHVGTHARLVFCLDLELVRGCTRSLGYRESWSLESFHSVEENSLGLVPNPKQR
jgi:hypothetical protein